MTLPTVWNWGREANLVTNPFPSKGLKYPKTKKKPAFMPFSEVETLTQGMADDLAAEYWEAVYLTVKDIEALLRHVENARLPFVYPMICFACYTGARRSEIARARVVDADLRLDSGALEKVNFIDYSPNSFCYFREFFPA